MRTHKICFVSSSGGHWEELMCLRAIAREHESFFVTEEGGQASDSGFSRLYTLPQTNRHEKNFPLRFAGLFRRAWKILRLERPDVVITTGALAAYPFCVLAKLRGGKVVYIESFARVRQRSLTGRLVYPLADLFLVQWESMLAWYPGAKYVGGIF